MGSIDPRIALGTQLPQPGRSPFQTLGALAQLDERRQLGQQRDLMNEQRRRALDDDYAIQETLSRTGNPDTAIEELYKNGRPDAAGALGKQIYEWRKTKAEQIKLETGNAHEKLKLATQVAQGITDQGSFDMGRRAINALLTPVLGQDITEQFGTEYDPERIKQLTAWGTERTQFLKQQQDAIANADKAIELGRNLNADIDKRAEQRMKADEYWSKAASGYLSTARSQEQWDAFQKMLSMGGASPTTLARFGNEYSPEAVSRATKLGMSPKDVEDVKHQKVTESQGQKNINLRKREIDARETDAEAAAGGAKIRSLTENRRSEIEQWRAQELADLEKVFKKEVSEGFFDEQLPTDGAKGDSLVKIERYNADNAREMAKMNARAGQRKLQIEDAYRAQLGQPPLVETEFELARDPSKSKELRKIRNTYRMLTGDEAPLEKLDSLRKKINSERDPAKAARLREELRALTNEYKQSIGQ